MLVIFGASGDLTARKLIPAIFNLAKDGHLPKNFVVLGASRSSWTHEEFRKNVPIQNYDDLSEYITRHIKGEENAEKDLFKSYGNRASPGCIFL